MCKQRRRRGSEEQSHVMQSLYPHCHDLRRFYVQYIFVNNHIRKVQVLVKLKQRNCCFKCVVMGRYVSQPIVNHIHRVVTH